MWIERIIKEKIEAAHSTFPAIILTGARQVGKTSLLKKMFPDYSFVTLDLPSAAELAEKEPEEFLKRYPPPVIIDEVQYAPQLFRHLKMFIDAERAQNGRFLLTGSQHFQLMNKVSDSLAGRCAVLELETLSLGEAAAAQEIDDLEMIFSGGFPELHARPELDRELFYRSYLATYLERDVRSLLQVAQLRDFERFLRCCALRSGMLLNKADLARDVGISPTTANQWLSVLAASHQIVFLEPWFKNKTKMMVKSPKLYLADPGLLCFLVGIQQRQELLRSPLAGQVFETFAFSELRKEQTFKQGYWSLHFWRDQRGLEVDFLAHQGGRFSLFESKFSELPDQRDAGILTKVVEAIGPKQIDQLALICRAKESYPLGAKVHAIPVRTLGRYV